MNGRALWPVCSWSTSVIWLQDSGGILELQTDLSSLPWPTDRKKFQRLQLIDFVNDWGTTDKSQSSLKSGRVSKSDADAGFNSNLNPG